MTQYMLVACVGQIYRALINMFRNMGSMLIKRVESSFILFSFVVLWVKSVPSSYLQYRFLSFRTSATLVVVTC